MEASTREAEQAWKHTTITTLESNHLPASKYLKKCAAASPSSVCDAPLDEISKDITVTQTVRSDEVNCSPAVCDTVRQSGDCNAHTQSNFMFNFDIEAE